MAASSPSASRGIVIGKYTLVCELGRRMPSMFAAHGSADGAKPNAPGGRELVVVEKLLRTGLSAKDVEGFTRTARRMALVSNAGVPRVREVIVTPELVAVASDFVEGETLAELNSPIEGKKRLELAVRLRILVDLLGALGAIHAAPELDRATEARAIVHGEVTPTNVLVGLDGTTRILRPHRVPLRGTILPEHVKATLGYVAPETLVGDGPDPRADLYAVGVMLWEAISGERLFEQSTPEGALTLQLAGDLPRAKVPADAPWAEPLVNIAARALQVSPEKRFTTAEDFADAIRRAVDAKLAPTLQVAAAVSARAGEKIEGRRARLKPASPSPISVPKVAPPRPQKGIPSKAIASPAIASPEATKPSESKTEDIDWQDVAEAPVVVPARSMPPPVPARAAPTPSRAPPLLPSRAPASIEAAPPPQAAPEAKPVALEQPSTAAVAVTEIAAPTIVLAPPAEVTDVVDVLAPAEIGPSIPPSTTSEDSQRRLLLPQRNPRVAIVAGLVGICLVILIAAAIRVAVRPKDSDTVSKKSEAVTPVATEETRTITPPIPPPAPEPPPVAAVAPTPPPEPAPVVARPVIEPAPDTRPAGSVAGKPTPHVAAPKVAKPRPKSNYEPQGI